MSASAVLVRHADAPSTRRVLVPHAIGGPPLPPLGSRAIIAVFGGRTMGTTWRVRVVVADDAATAAHRVATEALLATLIDDLSNWEPASALSRFNRSPLDAWNALPGTLIDVLVAAKGVHAASGGAFDPTVGAAVADWGFGPPGRIDGTPRAPCMDAVEVDVEARRARRRADVVLDLCGIAKGYAVDCLSHRLTARGAPHHLVEIGGELRGSGVKPDGMPWWVELETPPDDAGGGETVAALHGLSIATSGDYRHFFERDGRRYAHTIDPATGRPVVDALASATVLHRDCMRADAEATALVVLGVAAGLAHAEAHGLAARVIERSARGPVVHDTSAFVAMLS